MTYSRYQQLKPEDFKRLCGVHHQTFVCMVSVPEVVSQKQGSDKVGKLKTPTLLFHVCSLPIQMATLST